LCLPARALYASERARSNSNNAFNLWQEHLNFLGNIRVALRASAAQFMTCDPHCQRVLYSYKTWAYMYEPHIFHSKLIAAVAKKIQFIAKLIKEI
jgi:hypothetical protein